MEPHGIHRCLNESMEKGLDDFITAELHIKDGFTAIDAVYRQARAGGIGLADALGSAFDETALEGAIKDFLLMFHKHIDAGMLQQVDDIGFFPNLEDYREGAVFDMRSGEFADTAPLHRDYIEPTEAARIGVLMRMNYETMHLFRMSHDERNRCVELILAYYKLHVPNFPELKSLAVLQELFSK